jgi:type 1 fimbria pilin
MMDCKKHIKTTKIIYIFYFAVLNLLFSSTTLAANNVDHGGTKVNISGVLLDEPCTLETDDIDVDFGYVTNKDLFYGNDEKRKFEIRLVDCKSEAFNGLTVQFLGTATENNQLLNLNTGSVASGVGIKIFDDHGTPITFGQFGEVKKILQANGILEFQAILTKESTVQSVNEITLGPFTAVTIFNLKYE